MTGGHLRRALSTRSYATRPGSYRRRPRKFCFLGCPMTRVTNGLLCRHRVDPRSPAARSVGRRARPTPILSTPNFGPNTVCHDAAPETLRVGDFFAVAAPYAGRCLVLPSGDVRYRGAPYHGFGAEPGAMLGGRMPMLEPPVHQQRGAPGSLRLARGVGGRFT